MTQPVLNVIRDWTGIEPAGCPWRAFSDPFVARVLEAYTYFDKGQLASFANNASHRLIQGLGFYERILSIVKNKRWEQQREQAKSKGEASAKPRSGRQIVRRG